MWNTAVSAPAYSHAQPGRSPWTTTQTTATGPQRTTEPTT